VSLTIRELWDWLTEDHTADALLDWAPDVAALTSVLLERSHAFRFVVSPPDGATWPPPDAPFAARVQRTAERWRRAMDGASREIPDDVRRYCATLMAHLDSPLAEIAQGRPWEVCEAALALHAIADEASAGCAGSMAGSGPGHLFQARARETLARTGSMARLPTERVAQLPKSRTAGVGITHRSLSRYTCTTTAGIPVVWDRQIIRRRDSDPVRRHANIVLLPWPLHIRETDFTPVTGSVRRPEREPFGFFTYEPSEPLDLGLVERLLDAAVREVDAVDVVVLPEGCLDEDDIESMESLLAQHGVPMLVTGIRPRPTAPTRFAGNALHTGVLSGGRWWHYRQNKHHRWFLDGSQIEAYNIAGSLHPSVRWWEAMEIPERSLHLLDVGGGITVAAVVCEDLARIDGVADLLRSVGPTLVLTLLLDGPQLASRWTARYAGVLADDPGSAVLTLTALGMATRSQPRGMPPSRVVAMWKDPSRGLREIPLEPGAQGILLKAVLERSARYAADGRQPVDDVADLYIAGVEQLRADAAHGAAAQQRQAPGAPLGTSELTVMSAWAQAVVDSLGSSTAVEAVLTALKPGAGWRTVGRLAQPTGELAAALCALANCTTSALASDEGFATALDLVVPQDDLQAVAKQTLMAALEASRS